MKPSCRRVPAAWWMAGALLLTSAIYWPGLSGSWLFDDYPNIVDNPGVHPNEISISALVSAALSSPASSLKRPIASLSFAANYLLTGLDPFWMKLTNLAIHLLNGWLVFLLGKQLLHQAPPPGAEEHRAEIYAVLIATAWLLLPINITAVLYVVQRMESLANLFVLLGLLGYVAGRKRMLGNPSLATPAITVAESAPRAKWRLTQLLDGGLLICLGSIVIFAAIGLLAKETAVMLPLYALLIEWLLFRFRVATAAPTIASSHVHQPNPIGSLTGRKVWSGQKDWRLAGMFVAVLAVPMVIGLSWLTPNLLDPAKWATRDFTLGTRLLSEARIVVDYVGWTLLPTFHALSFYHDDFAASSGLVTPWSTLSSILVLAGLCALIGRLRHRRPLAALGIAMFLGCHLLTGTILPLELIYEHRNYFASFGLLLIVVPLLLPKAGTTRAATFASVRHLLLGALFLWWTVDTAVTAYAWGNPLNLAKELAERAPRSPRAQYELGRTYIIYSHYDLNSPFTRLAYAPLERAAALPDSSILPEQALIFMNSRMGLPLKETWWDSMIAKLAAKPAGIQDESSLATLTQCARDHRCNLPSQRMMEAFAAAMSHSFPSARLQSIYGDYAWNVLHDKSLGIKMTAQAVQEDPGEPAYRITLVRMLIDQGDMEKARQNIDTLQQLDVGGRLTGDIAGLRRMQAAPRAPSSIGGRDATATGSQTPRKK